MAVILRRVLHSMLGFHGGRPMSPTMPPRFCRPLDLFRGYGGILVLRPTGRKWAITGWEWAKNGPRIAHIQAR